MKRTERQSLCCDPFSNSQKICSTILGPRRYGGTLASTPRGDGRATLAATLAAAGCFHRIQRSGTHTRHQSTRSARGGGNARRCGLRHAFPLSAARGTARLRADGLAASVTGCGATAASQAFMPRHNGAGGTGGAMHSRLWSPTVVSSHSEARLSKCDITAPIHFSVGAKHNYLGRNSS